MDDIGLEDLHGDGNKSTIDVYSFGATKNTANKLAVEGLNSSVSVGS